MEYMCDFCRYRFEAEQAKKSCPYCSRAGNLRELSKAEDLFENE